ncbi:MAG TPA: hypothetical protein VMS84_07810 [Mycobacterium sp.]|jgi:hypothetical protein|nr:hypothetical protein [Mycobacterium sp.]
MNHHADDPVQWAAADDIVDQFIKALRTAPQPTSQIMISMLALDHPQRIIMLAMIAATALQRLASGEGH